ncbi:MAG: hypothetical protein RLY90_814 [Pseudomonadota bacterium]
MSEQAMTSPNKHPQGPLLVVGSGLAGWSVVREFRKLDTQTPVLMITADVGDFYAKPALSNALAQNKAPEQLVTTPAERMVSTLGVTLLQRTAVTSIDVQTQEVHTSKGTFGYRQLVLATGAQAIRLPLAGDAAQAVMSVNSLADYAAFRAQLKPQSRVLIMGAGLIGCEFANDLALGEHTVQVVDPGASPLAALLPEPASAQLRQALTDLGVNWHWQTTVQAVHRQDNAYAVQLANGQELIVDVVLSSVGLRADTALAQSAGIATDRGVLVDAQLKTNAEHVYALGDNTQYASASVGGVARTLPFVMPIMNAAKALAQTLAGNPTAVVFPLMPVAVKTPALPLVVSPPAPATQGTWQAAHEGIWHFVSDGKVRGFVLVGAQTSRRAEQSKLVLV